MATFAFKRELKLNEKLSDLLGTATAHSSLSEVMKLEGDYVIMEYMTEYEGPDLYEVSKDMRKIKADFSNEPEH